MFSHEPEGDETQSTDGVLGFRLEDLCFVTVKGQEQLGAAAMRFRGGKMKNSHLMVPIFFTKEKAWAYAKDQVVNCSAVREGINQGDALESMTTASRGLVSVH